MPPEARAKVKADAAAPPTSTPGTTTPAPGAPASPAAAADPEADALARIISEDRRLKSEAKRLERESEAIKAQKAALDAEIADAASIRAAKEAIAKGDRMGGLRKLGLTDKDLFGGEGSLFWDLAQAQSAAPGEDPKVQLAELVDKKLEEKEAARKEAEAKEAEAKKTAKAQEYETATATYLKEVDAAFDHTKFPALAAHMKGSKPRVDAFKAELISTFFAVHRGEVGLSGGAPTQGKVATPDELLAHFEAAEAERIRATPYGRPKDEPVKPPSPTVTAGWQRREATPAPPPGSLAEKKAALRANLRAAHAK